MKSSQELIRHIHLTVENKIAHFHAYYWGKFQFTEISEVGGYFIFAKATSLALDLSLSFKDDDIYLHNGQADPLLLTNDLQSFFKNGTDTGAHRIYDARPSYEALFTPAQMYVSDFSDPEDFEEVDAYLDLVKAIDTHFDHLLGLQNIQGEEMGGKKVIQLTVEDTRHTITLHKELFDIEILEALNAILANQFQLKESLHLSIDSKMRMIILKLDSEAMEMAIRMGLII